MFNKFRDKILITPLLALLSFVTVLIMSYVLNLKNTEVLTLIEKHYYPSIELNRELDRTLTAIQNELEDGVTSRDVRKFEKADSLYAQFEATLSKHSDGMAVESQSLTDLKNETKNYYQSARHAALQILKKRTNSSLRSWTDALAKYNAISQNLETIARQNKAEIEKAFATTRNNFDKSLLTQSLATIFFILLIVSLSIYLTQNLSNTVSKVVKWTRDFSQGKQDIQIEIKSPDEIGELAQAIREMMDKIRLSKEKIESQNWLKTGLTKLNDKMRGDQDQASLAKNTITFLSEYLNAQIGCLYLNGVGESFKLIGSYAFTKHKDLPGEYKPGEGIIGQAVLQKKPIVVSDIPYDYIRINYGIGEITPRHLIAVPFVYDGKVSGVIELGSFHKFSNLEMDFLSQAIESIAINFNSAQSRLRLKELLARSQQLAEELQTQQEELRQANEELEEQATSLRESESRLQVQQEELQCTNRELEEKTESLQKQKKDIHKKNQELEKAQKLLAERANELEITNRYKSEFLANMSHELRTPLNSLLILSRILSQNKEGTLTPKQVDFADTIHSVGTDLLNLINEILDLAKVESGKLELIIEELDLKDFVRDIEKNYTHLVEQKGLAFQVHTSKDLPEKIKTDPYRLMQIIKNFISNAIKFTQKGEITVSISRPESDILLSKSRLSPKEAIAISVKDTGKGIPENKQKLIFEAFQQEDGTTNRKYGGTGLGLSICRELAKLMGGEIQLKSRAGKGSTFTFYVPETLSTKPKEDGVLSSPKTPVAARDSIADKKTQTHSLSATPVDDDRDHFEEGGRRILVIEDDPNFAKILVNVARQRGAQCIVAKDGQTGLEFVYKYNPQAIILDIGLPDISGWTVMERLKDDPQTRHIPVHFISASDESMEAMRMGAIGFLTKPVNMEALEKAFNKIENTVSKSIKNLLIVEDNREQQKSILELIGNHDVHSIAVGSGKQAIKLLKSKPFDCMILDLGLKDMHGFDLLEKLKQDKSLPHIPVIVYTGQEISHEEHVKLQEHAKSIIIKGVRSSERLQDEVALFLHRVEKDLPGKNKKMFRMLHDRETLFEGKRILLVDDDMRNVFALSNVLEEKRMKVLVGKNGKEGLEQLRKNPGIDLILMDIMMPEMDGYEAMRKIREQPKFKNIPLIALTAKAMKGDRIKCIEAGANDYLAKPVDQDKLLSLLRVWLYR
ncbi:MAG: response regulator [Calditrichaeota bacterium]|nr:response regulator [Calditrichota bacterium]